MTFKVQFPPYVRRAMEIAGLHMAYQSHFSHDPAWALRLRPVPLNIQAPEPTLTAVGEKMRNTVCVTLRFPSHKQVKVHLVQIMDGGDDWMWKLLQLDSITSHPTGVVVEYSSEGGNLFRKIVEFYGLPVDLLEYEVVSCDPIKMTGNGLQTVVYRFPNGETCRHVYRWQVRDGLLCRMIMAPHGLEVLCFLSDQKINFPETLSDAQLPVKD